MEQLIREQPHATPHIDVPIGSDLMGLIEESPGEKECVEAGLKLIELLGVATEITKSAGRAQVETEVSIGEYTDWYTCVQDYQKNTTVLEGLRGDIITVADEIDSFIQNPESFATNPKHLTPLIQRYCSLHQTIETIREKGRLLQQKTRELMNEIGPAPSGKKKRGLFSNKKRASSVYDQDKKRREYVSKIFDEEEERRKCVAIARPHEYANWIAGEVKKTLKESADLFSSQQKKSPEKDILESPETHTQYLAHLQRRQALDAHIRNRLDSLSEAQSNTRFADVLKLHESFLSPFYQQSSRHYRQTAKEAAFDFPQLNEDTTQQHPQLAALGEQLVHMAYMEACHTDDASLNVPRGQRLREQSQTPEGQAFHLVNFFLYGNYSRPEDITSFGDFIKKISDNPEGILSLGAPGVGELFRIVAKHKDNPAQLYNEPHIAHIWAYITDYVFDQYEKGVLPETYFHSALNKGSGRYTCEDGSKSQARKERILSWMQENAELSDNEVELIDQEWEHIFQLTWFSPTKSGEHVRDMLARFQGYVDARRKILARDADMHEHLLRLEERGKQDLDYLEKLPAYTEEYRRNIAPLTDEKRAAYRQLEDAESYVTIEKLIPYFLFTQKAEYALLQRVFGSKCRDLIYTHGAENTKAFCQILKKKKAERGFGQLDHEVRMGILSLSHSAIETGLGGLIEALVISERSPIYMKKIIRHVRSLVQHGKGAYLQHLIHLSRYNKPEALKLVKRGYLLTEVMAIDEIDTALQGLVVEPLTGNPEDSEQLKGVTWLQEEDATGLMSEALIANEKIRHDMESGGKGPQRAHEKQAKIHRKLTSQSHIHIQEAIEGVIRTALYDITGIPSSGDIPESMFDAILLAYKLRNKEQAFMGKKQNFEPLKRLLILAQSGRSHEIHTSNENTRYRHHLSEQGVDMDVWMSKKPMHYETGRIDTERQKRAIQEDHNRNIRRIIVLAGHEHETCKQDNFATFLSDESIGQAVRDELQFHLSELEKLDAGGPMGISPMKQEATIELSMEQDPLLVLQMGSHFSNSCLALGKVNDFSTVANAVDINKRVIYARYEGKVIGRTLIALDDEGNLLRYTTFNRSAFNIDPFFEDYIHNLMQQANIQPAPLTNQPEKIMSDAWYDDGAISLVRS